MKKKNEVISHGGQFPAGPQAHTFLQKICHSTDAIGADDGFPYRRGEVLNFPMFCKRGVYEIFSYFSISYK